MNLAKLHLGKTQDYISRYSSWTSRKYTAKSPFCVRGLLTLLTFLESSLWVNIMMDCGRNFVQRVYNFPMTLPPLSPCSPCEKLTNHRADWQAERASRAVLRHVRQMSLGVKRDGLVTTVIARHVAFAAVNAQVFVNKRHHLLLVVKVTISTNTIQRCANDILRQGQHQQWMRNNTVPSLSYSGFLITGRDIV